AAQRHVLHSFPTRRSSDLDVPRALRRGQIEMGAPGIWQLDAFAPEGGITMLPMFYGLPAEVTYAVVDGPLGEKINRRIEEKLGRSEEHTSELQSRENLVCR